MRNGNDCLTLAPDAEHRDSATVSETIGLPANPAFDGAPAIGAAALRVRAVRAARKTAMPAASEENVMDKPRPDTAPRKRSRAGDGNGPALHPLIQGLVDEIPRTGSSWAEAKRWLRLAEDALKVVYGGR